MLHNHLHFRESAVALSTRDAAVRPATFNAQANTVEAVIATGNPVRRQDATGAEYLEVLDIAGADLTTLRGASVLDSHRQAGVNGVLGVVEECWREGNVIAARIRLSTRPEVASIVEDIRAGIVANVSVGYEVQTWAESVGANGIAIRTATAWRPREVSFVAVNADPVARTRAADRMTVNRSIRELCTRAGASELANDLNDRGASLEQANAAILDHLIQRSNVTMRTAHNANTFDNPSFASRAIGDALYARLSGTQPTEPARMFMHRSTIDTMRELLQLNGTPMHRASDADVYRAAMHTRSAPGMHSVSDFPTLLADTMNRRLGELFRAAESGASAIVATGTARDFRPITEARLSSFPSLEPLGESGEIKWGTLDEEGEKLAIASFARAIGVTFPVLVNDDLSAIDRSIRDVAFATAQLKAKLIIAALAAKLADGKALFHADHKNLASAGAAPGEGTLAAGMLAMSKQGPPNSTEPLGLSPSILLVPSELDVTARKLVASITPTTTADVNVFAGRRSIAVEPRLPNAVQWFLFAAPGTYPVIRFLTLAGFEAPRFETENEFTRLGTAYRVHWHVGAGPIDFRGAWKNAGA